MSLCDQHRHCYDFINVTPILFNYFIRNDLPAVHHQWHIQYFPFCSHLFDKLYQLIRVFRTIMIQPFKEMVMSYLNKGVISFFDDKHAFFICVKWLLLRTSDDDIVVIIKFVKGWEIFRTFDLIAFFEGGQHDNWFDLELQNHSPKVVTGLGFGTLACNVFLFLLEALSIGINLGFTNFVGFQFFIATEVFLIY